MSRTLILIMPRVSVKTRKYENLIWCHQLIRCRSLLGYLHRTLTAICSFEVIMSYPVALLTFVCPPMLPIADPAAVKVSNISLEVSCKVSNYRRSKEYSESM